MREFLDNLNVGDKVVVRYSYGHSDRYKISKIVKKTPTGKIRVECDPNCLFTDGTYRISDWDRITLEPITIEIMNRIEKGQLLEEVRSIKFSTLSLTCLKEVLRVIKENE